MFFFGSSRFDIYCLIFVMTIVALEIIKYCETGQSGQCHLTNK